MPRLLFLLAAILFGWLASADIAAAQLHAEPCRTRFANIQANLRDGIAVPGPEVEWAMQYERGYQCDMAAAPAVAAHMRQPVATTPMIAQGNSSAPLAPPGPPGVSMTPGGARCTQPIRLDPGSASPCDWFALSLAHISGNGAPQNDVLAVQWARRAADAGHATAQYGLGEAYSNGFGGLPRDNTEAFRWTLAAARQGHPGALDATARNYLNGVGTAIDKVKAVEYFRLAAEAGDLGAAVVLGILFWQGDGVALSQATALRYFRHAAERGDADGQYFLGDAYRRGEGAPFDLQQARYWLGKSAAQGNKAAVDTVAYIAQIDRQHASAAARSSPAGASSGPSAYEKAIMLNRRQGQENCAAALQGRSRICNLP